MRPSSYSAAAAALPGNKKTPSPHGGDGVQNKQSANSNLNRRAAIQQRVERQSKIRIHYHAQYIPPNRPPVNCFFCGTNLRGRISPFWVLLCRGVDFNG
jgi:hypothetical protein